jgi:hypothetical protein
MEEKIRVSYEQIKNANAEIETIKLGAKGYAQVNERIKAFRKVYPTGKIATEIVEIDSEKVRTYTVIEDGYGNVIATGSASETNTGNNKVNQTSMLENCETSSVGRALGFAGFGVDASVASAEDIEAAKNRSSLYEIYPGMFIRDEMAKYYVKVAIGDLMRKMGVAKAGLALQVEQELWTSLEEMTTRQLLKLENKLKTLNMDSNDWNHLYAENTKIKDIVPKNQEVIYESSWFKFGKAALEQAGTDELLRNDIINAYLDMGINLEG